MTLLDEYQALPGEPELSIPRREKKLPYLCSGSVCVSCGVPVGGDWGLVPDVCGECHSRHEAIFYRRQVYRRDAVIRLLVKALRHATTSVEVLAPLGKQAAHEYLDQAREDRALLTAVERDFPEGV